MLNIYLSHGHGKLLNNACVATDAINHFFKNKQYPVRILENPIMARDRVKTSCLILWLNLFVTLVTNFKDLRELHVALMAGGVKMHHNVMVKATLLHKIQ